MIIDDAARYLREEGKDEQYDVIICDSSDPIGPADVLFQSSFFHSVKEALNPVGGIFCNQGECLWIDLDFITKVMKDIREIFPKANYASTSIPTYPTGQIGFMIATVDVNTDLSRKCSPSWLYYVCEE